MDRELCRASCYFVIYLLFLQKSRGRHNHAQEVNVPFGQQAVSAIQYRQRQEEAAPGHGEMN